MSEAISFDELVKVYEKRIKSTRAYIEEFANKLLANPVQTMKYSDWYITQMANNYVDSIILEILQTGYPLLDIAEIIEKRALQGLEDAVHGSSAVGSHMRRELGAVWLKTISRGGTYFFPSILTKLAELDRNDRTD